MALSVATLAGYPAINTTLQRSAGTPTDAITHAYSSGVYTPTPGTIYVAGILDQQGINPSRIFQCDNNTGGAATGTKTLPTLVTVTQVSAHGQSLANLPSNYTGGPSFNEVTDATGYAGFLVVLATVNAQTDSGVYPLGYNNQTTFQPNDVPGWTSQGGAYTNAAITVGYPQPQMRFFVTMSALLIIASTSTG
jgi:hypothetical protein